MSSEKIMNSKILLASFASLSVSLAFGAIRSVTPDMYGGDTNAWQLARHAGFLKNIQTNGDAKVVFIGDSITHYWETSGKLQWQKYFSDGELKAINLGVSADRTEHVLWRIGAGGELDGYEAKAVVLMIGTNNAGHFPREKEPVMDTVLGVREILKTIRAKQPQAKIVLCAIFPRGTDMSDATRMRNDLVNKEIMKFADGKDIVWCDFRDQFMTHDGRLPREIFPDYLHPDSFGYEIWASAVIPYLRASVRGEPLPPNRYAPFIRDGQYGVDHNLSVFPATRNRIEGYGTPDWCLDRDLEKRNQIVDSNGEFDLVFAGDSITHFWETNGKESFAELQKTYSILDIGYSGDRTEHLLWRCENGELDGYKTKCIMLMIGTNNSNQRRDDPKDIAEATRRIIAVMQAKQPQAKILLLPIFPCGENDEDWQRVNNEKVKPLIRAFADGERVIWLDFNDQFLDEKRSMMSSTLDGYHPNAGAYKNVWLPNVLPYFQKIVGK